MTLEARLVQKIKGETLFQLIGDEDAIEALVGRALKEALFLDRRDPSWTGYGSPKMMDSPVMAAAREVAQSAMQTLVEREVEALQADPDAMRTLRMALAEMLPGALAHVLASAIGSQVRYLDAQGVDRMQNWFRERADK